VQRPPNTQRTAPLPGPNIRRHTARQVDASLNRDYFIRVGHKFQFKVGAYNLTNTPIFGFHTTDPASPLFGVVPITQFNNPRSVEWGCRYVF
jgi:hypothetical protein